MAGKIIVAGHICLDITPVFPEEKSQPLSKVLIPGKLIQTKAVNVNTGGAVANTGLALKFFGADVSLMGKIGADEFGAIIEKKLRTHGAQDGLIVSPGESTSYSIVIAPPGTDRIFLHNPGANETFTAEDLDFEKIKEAELFHFGYPTIMHSMYREDGRELEAMFKRVKELGVLTSLDMAAVDADTEAGRADWKAILGRVLPYVDYFVPSIEELGFMLDRGRYEGWLRKADGGDVTSVIEIDADVRPLADELLRMGAKHVLIKCGAPGMYYQNDKFSMFERSYKPECVRSGTGAGDTSIAAFLKAVLDGYSIEECLKYAAATGASCVEAYDALGGLRSFEEMKNKIDAGWEKNTSIPL